MAPSHCLNQCSLIISKVQWHSFECNFTRDTLAISQINLKISCLNFFSKSPRNQRVKAQRYLKMVSVQCETCCLGLDVLILVLAASLEHHQTWCVPGRRRKTSETLLNMKMLSYQPGNFHCTGIILSMGSANERRRYIVTPPLMGCAHTQKWLLL